MMNDNLKTIFDSYRPDLGDADAYMERLQAKMQVLAAVRRYAVEQRRLWRRRVAIALVTGLVLGAATTVFMLLHPLAVVPDPKPLVWILQNARPFMAALAIAGASIGMAFLCTLQPLRDFSRSTP